MPDPAALQRKVDMLPAVTISLVKGLLPDCATLLPPDISGEHFRAALWLELTGRPELQDCTPQSLRDCIVKAATYGLLPGRDCHFLPFRNRKGNNKLATYVPNYQGIILALERTGKVRRAFAHAVNQGDTWEYDYFSDRPIHRPAATMGKASGPELFYYGAIQFKDGTFAIEILTLEELEKIRRSSPAHDSGPWVDWPDMMKRKSALKRVAKYVRLTPSTEMMIEDDDERERQDIPADRHVTNITDLFGDDPRGSTPAQAPSVPRLTQPPAPASCGWRDTFEKHLIETDLNDARVPAALREECLVAFHAATVPDSVGLGLAGALLDALHSAEEGP